MLHRRFVGGALRVATAALVLSIAITPTAFAKGGPGKGDDGPGNDKQSVPNCNRGNQSHDDDDEGRDRGDRLFCPNKQVLVRIDEKLCPEKPGRPAVIRKRVCCRHGDMTNCHPFRPCPPRSRS